MASGGSKEKVGDFTINIGDILGFGAFGIVTTGTDANGKPVAVKRIQLLDERKSRNISNELDILKNLHHKNIVKIFKVDRQQMVLWIIMEYCQYGDLKNFFRSRSLSDKQKFEMMHQISMGVEYLHSKDIIHRDIKPQNILVAQEEPVVVKLTDFDCSKFLDPHYETSCMSTNVGTPAFKAPEFFKRLKVGDSNRIEYHRNIDIYAAGLTFLAMIQGNENLAPIIETANDESERFQPIGQLIAERIKYKIDNLQIIKIPRLQDMEEELLSAQNGGIQQLKKLIREMTRPEPTDRISAAQVVQRIQQILKQIPRVVKIKLVKTVDSGVNVLCERRFAVIQTGHVVFWGNSSPESPAALHIFIKSPEGLEKVREVKGFCEHGKLHLTTFRSEFLAVLCRYCRKIRLYNILTTEVTTAFHHQHPGLITAVAAAEEGVMYVNNERGVLKLNTEQIPFTVTQTIDIELQLSGWNMIHIPAPYNLLVFNQLRSSSAEVLAVSFDSGKKRWAFPGESEYIRGSWATCYSKEHEVLLVGETCTIWVLDPEDGSLIHTVELGEGFHFIFDLHILDKTLIVHHCTSDLKHKVSFFALE